MKRYLTDPDAWHLIDKPGGGKTLWVYPGELVGEAKKVLGSDYVYSDLNDAIAAANSSDTVRVMPGPV